MLKRLTANTETLQQTFPSVYRDFFAVCQRVASASNSFLWTGEFSGFYGGLTVSQKLPIRSFVGLETTFDNQVSVNREYTTFDAPSQEFTTNIIDDRLVANLKKYLEQYCKSDKTFTGVKVHILTEIPLGHSLGSNGAIAAALALLTASDQQFDTVFATAREILSLSQAGFSSGVSAYMALTDAVNPVVFFKKDNDYVARPIEELAGLSSLPIWPIDFGLVYTGTQANAESVILANNETVSELEAVTSELNVLLAGEQRHNFKQTYLDMLNLTTGLAVTSLVELFKKGTKQEVLEQFFNSLNQYQNLLHILHLSSGSTDLIYSRIHQLANKQINDVGSGVKVSGIGRGGAVLFAVPYGTHRKTLLEMLSELSKETGRPIWLDYASWIDGIGGRPGVIEQDITKGQHAPFVDRDSLALTLLNKGKLRQQLITKERFEELQKDIDLLLDKTTGKITIAGNTVTSKELPSQKATVSIMTDLIKAKKFILKNTELPSAYGTSRYDLQGKIALPLVKQVKVHTGRDLQLKVMGEMYDNYELLLDPSNIVIGVVEKKH